MQNHLKSETVLKFQEFQPILFEKRKVSSDIYKAYYR